MSELSDERAVILAKCQMPLSLSLLLYRVHVLRFIKASRMKFIIYSLHEFFFLFYCLLGMPTSFYPHFPFRKIVLSVEDFSQSSTPHKAFQGIHALPRSIYFLLLLCISKTLYSPLIMLILLQWDDLFAESFSTLECESCL